LAQVLPGDEAVSTTIRGRDLVTGLPREVILTDSDIREAIANSIQSLIDATKEVLEITPPEIVADIMKRGIYLTGGGALIKRLDEVLQEEIGIPVIVASDPLLAVAKGTGEILEKSHLYAEALITDDEDIS